MLPGLLATWLTSVKDADHPGLALRTGSGYSRQSGPISCDVIRNSGALHKYPNRALTVPGPLPCSTPSFPRLLFVTLSLAPFFPFHHYPAPVTGMSFDLLQHLTWRPTWTAKQQAHLASARLPGGPVRPWLLCLLNWSTHAGSKVVKGRSLRATKFTVYAYIIFFSIIHAFAV